MTSKRVSRRNILQHGSLVAGIPFMPFLRECTNLPPHPGGSVRPGYGPIIEQPGKLLHLPRGFEYYAFSPTARGCPMDAACRVHTTGCVPSACPANRTSSASCVTTSSAA